MDTSTEAVAVAAPPGPVARTVYVVESFGLTRCDPSADTLPTPGINVTWFAFDDDHVSVVVSPFVIVPGEALSVTVGAVGAVGAVDCAAGALAAVCFWQPAKIKIAAIAIGNANRHVFSFFMSVISISVELVNEFFRIGPSDPGLKAPWVRIQKFLTGKNS